MSAVKRKHITETVDFNGVCYAYKNQIETLMQTAIQKNSFADGLQIKSKAVYEKLQSIKAKPTKSTDDINYIVNEVIPNEPPAMFIDKNENFCNLVQKYRVVSEIQDKLNDMSLSAEDRVKHIRKIFSHHGEAIVKSTDSNTQQFLKDVRMFLESRGRVSANSQMFSAKAYPQLIDQVPKRKGKTPTNKM